ncbi:hypothetical protein LTR85_008796 [Meristemomyces frigidus]|nr:hypothetical protein LTR85_008796 [Meristemomyces frigidus]
MDPLSIVGFSTALAGHILSVVKLLQGFFRGAERLPRRLTDLTAELQAFRGVVVSVQLFSDNTTSATAAIDFETQYKSGSVTQLFEVLRTCHSRIERFKKTVEKAAPQDGSNVLARGWKALKLDDSEIEDLRKLLHHELPCVQTHMLCLQMGLLPQNNDTHKLESENAALRSFIESLTSQCAAHEKTTRATSTVDNHQLLDDLEAAKEASIQVARVVRKEIRRRKTLDESLPLIPTGHCAVLLHAPSSSNGPTAALVEADSKVTGHEQDAARPLGYEEFEGIMSALVSKAEATKATPDKPYSDNDFDEICKLLLRVGKPVWSQRPRTYLILRMIDEVDAMGGFVVDGRKDVHLPYSESNLPDCLTSVSARQSFLQKQKLVLSQKHLDIIKGGPHRHFGE